MKYIKSFDNATDMINYAETAPGKKSYLFMNNAGTDGIGTSLTSGKKIISYRKPQYDYLTFKAEQANSTVKIYSFDHLTSAEYSTDGGLNWNNASGVTVTLANVGDKVKFRGVAKSSTINSSTFTMTGKISASGSVMSMYNMNPDDTIITITDAFMYMLKNCTSLVSAPELPATTLSNSCYYSMFQGCTSLISAPELPATTLANYCYQNMFQGCTSLTTAPELPATTLTSYCYENMFKGCTSLTDVTIHITGTNWNTSHTSDWLSGTAASGTIHNLGNCTNIPSDSNSGVPTGWTLSAN